MPGTVQPEWPVLADKNTLGSLYSVFPCAAYACIVAVSLLETEAPSHNCVIFKSNYAIKHCNCEIFTSSCIIVTILYLTIARFLKIQFCDNSNVIKLQLHDISQL